MNNGTHITAWIAALDSEDPDEQEQAVDNLVRVGEKAVEPLIRAMQDGNEAVCANAVEALGQIGDRRAVAPLILALKDDNTRVIMAAITALRRIGDPLAVPALIEFLNEDDIYIHFHATHALAQIRHPDTVSALLEELQYGHHPNVMHGCIVALGRLGDRAAIPPLVELLNSPEEKIRYSAVYALGDLAGSDDQAVIIALRPLLEDFAPNVRDVTQTVLVKLEGR